ncbi:MAG: LPS-assembly protein LptD, partial [Treponema sp.]|nr:LPS-assembly protein LptD [Treponema sp.]
MSIFRFGFRAVLLFSLFLCCVPPCSLYAQEDTEAALNTQVSEPEIEYPAADFTAANSGAASKPESSRIELEIKTSTLTELAAWCRSLGLPEGGAREALAQRLRAHFELVEPAAPGETEIKQKIITIESARSTEYFTLEVVDEEYARLVGDVVVSLKDGEAVHTITAWEILYNRTRNLITASGGVEYTKRDGDSVETFKGESITVNIDNWSSIFLGGVSERSLSSDNTTYRFAGTVISRSDEEVTVLTRAEISNAQSEETFWSVSASKIWLLPGSDFAILNAVLKVGEIPMLYFPFFYYPSDEIIFHPVLGFRSREGNFVQTTTYILGRPQASSSSESSITKILGASGNTEKVRQGMFLRSTGKKSVDPGSTTLKALIDLYANLGAYIGAEMTLPSKGVLGGTNLSAGIGITRTIGNPSTGNYTPFAPAYDGTSDWNHSRFISWDVPFRYRLNYSGSLNLKFGSLSWTFPYYSDPSVDRDFLNRSEEMDYMHMIQEGNAAAVEETTDSLLGAYEWRLSGSVNPSFPKLAPYISGLSLSSITSTLAFKYKPSASIPQNSTAPERNFFHPDKLTIFNVSGSISGSPLSLGRASAVTKEPARIIEPEDILKNIGVPRSPWETEDVQKDPKKKTPDPLSPPVLAQRFDLPRAGNTLFNIDYRLSPTAASELQFRTQHWPEYDTIDWGEVSSILSTFGGDASTTFNLSDSSGFYTNSFSFSGNGSWREYSFINEEAEEYTDASGNPDPVKVSEANRQAYSQSYFSTSYAYTASIRPLFRSSVWGSSSVQYNFGGLLAKSNFIGTGDDPDWEVKYGAWDKDNLNTHSFSTNINAAVMDKTQTFTLSSDLPPKDVALSANATFRVWITETNAHMRILNPGEEDKRKLEPFYATETIRFGSKASLSQYLVLDTEERELTTLTTNFSMSGFSAAFTATRSQGYDFVGGKGWVLNTGEPSLKSRDLSLGYSKSFSKTQLWNNRLSFSLNLGTRFYLDFQRLTNSNLGFNLGFTLGITKFLDLSFSSTSE